LAGAGFALAFIGAVTAPAATAQRGGDAPAQTEGRQFGSKSGAVVNEALTLMNSNQYGAAISKLNEAISMDLNAYERSTTMQMMGTAYYEMENYPQAISSFENAINAGGLLLLNFLYNNLGMTGKQADIVKQMLQRYPEDITLWNTWASMLSNGGREDDAFEVKKMLYLGGALKTESEIMQIIQYYSFYEMPYQAAQILEREMNAGVVSKSTDRLIQLSDLLRQAREYKKAIPILQQAAAGAGSGKVYAQLGEALYNDAQCDKAEEAFKQSINLGYNRGKAWMLIATCRYEESQAQERIDCKWSDEQKANAPRTKMRDVADNAFSQVPGSSSESRSAVKWRQFIKAEAQAVENRCIFEANVEKELFVEIKQAYAAQVFKGGDFILANPQKCEPFVPEYDSIYRVKVEG